MGAQSTFLMGPPRQPLNANIDKDLQKWARVFSEEQGAAFDDRSWRYFTGEWFENGTPAIQTTLNTAAACTSSTSSRAWLKTVCAARRHSPNLHGIGAPSIREHHGEP